MAIPFQPKFVDLVRNTTTTSGTGNFVLGGAVAGFTSLATAVSVGEQFYYCVMGVDKPAEREVGRGTMMTNGTVARQPIAGAATNFTNGTKTISLVVAAEWYDLLRQWVAGGASDLSGLATNNKTSLVAAVNEVAGSAAGAVMRTFVTASGATISANQIDTAGYSEIGKGGARYVFSAAVDAAFVAANPRTSFMAAGGRGFRIDQTQPLTPLMLGAKADGTTDDYAALQAWLDLGGGLYLPPGKYRSAQRLLVRRFVAIKTAGYGFDSRVITTMGQSMADMPGAQIKFDAGVGGLYFMNQSVVDSVATNVADPALYTTQEGAMHSYLGPVGLIGGGGAAATGLYARTVVHLDGVQVYNFSGKGFDVSASSDAADGNSEYGNTSLSTFSRCLAKSNGSHGFHIRGRDANVITLLACNAQQNGGWGFLDDGLLGNNYTGCHAATNTLGGYRGSSTVGDHNFMGCYIEPGTGSNVYINSRCAVVGGSLSEIAIPTSAFTNTAALKPNVLGSQAASLNDIQMSTAQNAYGAISGTSHIYRHADGGLTLQGSANPGGGYSLTFRNASDTVLLQFLNTATNAYFAGPIFVGGNQVVNTRGAAVADATDAASAITQLNALLARVRAHGLIA